MKPNSFEAACRPAKNERMIGLDRRFDVSFAPKRQRLREKWSFFRIFGIHRNLFAAAANKIGY
jgi:hypothetical protein